MEMLGGLLGCTKTQVDYVLHLERNLKSLRIEMKKMMELYDDLLRKLEDKEEQHMKRTAKVAGWLDRVVTMKREVDSILDQSEQQIRNRSLGRWFKNWWSAYKLGKEVVTYSEALSILKTDGNFNEDELANLLKRPKVDQIPIPVPVGMDSSFEQACCFIQKNDVHIIGIYGMGGVGKTTLLKRINNVLSENGQEFDFVIWVEVSRYPNVGKIQDKIAEKLRFHKDTWGQRNRQEKTVEIFNLLIKKSFVLLLDDLWDPQFDLQVIGIPYRDPNLISKIIFTTRSEDVIGGMGADKRIKVGCLTEEEAWVLFREKVGREALDSHPKIEDQAKLVAKECGGLPLALITVGRAMASRKTLDEWSYALHVLKESASKFPFMEDKVLRLLRFSYDSLGDEMTKACFLYCSSFPEDWPFNQQKVIEIWIAEGFLKDGNLHMATQKGKNIISELKRACLLETITDGYSFRMHDVVHDMALWVYSEKGERYDKHLVQRDLLIGELREPLPISKWETARTISSLRHLTGKLEGEPKCDNLLSLDLSSNYFDEITNDFFQYMPNLKVLDLSGNYRLMKLPESLFKVTSLQFLDLRGTSIKTLPPTFNKLQKLKFLSLNDTTNLRVIPPQVISSLSNLERLESQNIGISDSSINEMLDELQYLEALQHLKFTVKSNITLEKLLRSEKLNKMIYGLCIQQCIGSRTLQLRDNDVLQKLMIYHCKDLEEVTLCWTRNDMRNVCFGDLSHVDIIDCKLLKNATLLSTLPNIKELTIMTCESMEEIIGVDGGGASMVPTNTKAFERLEYLCLWILPALKCICSHALPFPCLTTLSVMHCPKLKKLPFAPITVRKN